MRAGTTTLKLAGAAGTLVVCGASGLAVAIDTKPASAPLKPPVAGGSTAAPPATAQTDPSGLVIPAGGTCAQPAQTAAGSAKTPLPAVPAGLQAVVQQYAQAKTQQQKQQVLSALTPDQRMQLTAYLQLVAQSRQGGKNGGGSQLGLSCLGRSPSQSASGGAQINADVVAGRSRAPISVSVVS